jgi:hypothetical protein
MDRTVGDLTVALMRRACLRAAQGAAITAALVAGGALVAGELTPTGWRIIATTVMFGLAMGMAAAGFGVRPQSPALGACTVAAAALAFVFLAVGTWWTPDGAGFWRATLGLTVLALELANVSAVRSRCRATDPASALVAAEAATAMAAVSTAMSLGLVVGVVDPAHSPAYWQVLGLFVIGQVLATALAPLQRRLDRSPTGAGSTELTAGR